MRRQPLRILLGHEIQLHSRKTPSEVSAKQLSPRKCFDWKQMHQLTLNFRKETTSDSALKKRSESTRKKPQRRKRKKKNIQRNPRSTSSRVCTDGSGSRPFHSQKASAGICKPSLETRQFSERSPRESGPFQRLSTLKPQAHLPCSASSHDHPKAGSRFYQVYRQDFL